MSELIFCTGVPEWWIPAVHGTSRYAKYRRYTVNGTVTVRALINTKCYIVCFTKRRSSDYRWKQYTSDMLGILLNFINSQHKQLFGPIFGYFQPFGRSWIAVKLAGIQPEPEKVFGAALWETNICIFIHVFTKFTAYHNSHSTCDRRITERC